MIRLMYGVAFRKLYLSAQLASYLVFLLGRSSARRNDWFLIYLASLGQVALLHISKKNTFSVSRC